MNIGYKKFYERLRQEREEKKWSQENISQLLCVTQGHYCKIESGYNRLSFKEIVDLNKSEINMYYVFTGVKISDLKFKELLEKYTPIEQMWIYEIVATIVYNVRRHIVGGANRTLISVEIPPRSCRIGTCRRFSAG